MNGLVSRSLPCIGIEPSISRASTRRSVERIHGASTAKGHSRQDAVDKSLDLEAVRVMPKTIVPIRTHSARIFALASKWLIKWCVTRMRLTSVVALFDSVLSYDSCHFDFPSGSRQKIPSVNSDEENIYDRPSTQLRGVYCSNCLTLPFCSVVN